MDLNPLQTPKDVLVSALNATIITKNGNEPALQNDFGNGRIETAFLPTGFIPVGVCEFGDIIYITSYNPLENKCQIGCFPSPERNISTDELDQPDVSISNTFQEINDGKATGKLLNTEQTYMIGLSKLNPGDQYLISLDKDVTQVFSPNDTEKITYLTDLYNDAHEINKFPKLIRISIICIDDNSKIVDLGGTVKWFNPPDYYLAQNKTSSAQQPNLDAYRNLLSDGYAVFNSKYPGKLALQIKLEMPTSFTCTVSGIEVNNNG